MQKSVKQLQAELEQNVHPESALGQALASRDALQATLKSKRKELNDVHRELRRLRRKSVVDSARSFVGRSDLRAAMDATSKRIATLAKERLEKEISDLEWSLKSAEFEIGALCARRSALELELMFDVTALRHLETGQPMTREEIEAELRMLIGDPSA